MYPVYFNNSVLIFKEIHDDYRKFRVRQSSILKSYHFADFSSDPFFKQQIIV